MTVKLPKLTASHTFWPHVWAISLGVVYDTNMERNYFFVVAVSLFRHTWEITLRGRRL